MRIRPTVRVAALEWLLMLPVTLAFLAASHSLPPWLSPVGIWFISSLAGVTITYLVLPAIALGIGGVALWGFWRDDWWVRTNALSKVAIVFASLVAMGACAIYVLMAAFPHAD